MEVQLVDAGQLHRYAYLVHVQTLVLRSKSMHIHVYFRHANDTYTHMCEQIPSPVENEDTCICFICIFMEKLKFIQRPHTSVSKVGLLWLNVPV